MKTKYVVCILIILFLIVLYSCSKNEDVKKHSFRSDPSGIAITIDTTWDGDTTINLKP